MIRGALSWISRGRHALGFGIHSPFAFMLVRDVVQDHNAYYGYHELETASASPDGLSEREARFLLRICGRLGVRTVLSDASSPRFVAAVRDGGTHVVASLQDAGRDDEVPMLIYALRTPPDSALIAERLRTPGNAVLLHSDFPCECRVAMPGGVIFTSRHGVLAVSRENMPLVECDMKLPLDCV